MRVICALLLIIMSGLLVPPRPAAAQSLSCDLASLLPYPVRGVLGTPWADETSISVDHVTITLRICAPATDNVAGLHALQLARDALPILDELTAMQLGGSISRTIIMVDSTTIYSQNPNADGFIEQHTDTIHLHPRSLQSTIVHELAHYWANHDNFGEPWMVEAYAEYLTDLVMPRLDPTYTRRQADPACAGIALLSWTPDLSEHESCAYAVGSQVFHDLEARVGTDQLRATLATRSTGHGGVNSWDLLVALEAVSGADLTDVFRGRVFRPQDEPILAQRSALRARFAQATDLAVALGVTLPGPTASLIDSWHLADADAVLNDLIPLLTAARATDTRCRDLKLACVQPWRNLDDSPAHWRGLTADLERATPILEGYSRLQEASVAIGLSVPTSIQAAAASLDASALPTIQASIDNLLRASTLEQRCMEIMTHSCRSYWQAAWGDGDLAAVRRIIGEFNDLLNAASKLEERCGAMAEGCRGVWVRALDLSGPAAARQALTDLARLLDRAGSAEAYCEQQGWPCSHGWSEQLASGDLAAANGLLEAQAVILPTLLQGEARLRALDSEAQLDDARQAFDHGDTARAQILVVEAIRHRLIMTQTMFWASIVLGLVLLLLCVGLLTAAYRRWGGRIRWRWPRVRLPAWKLTLPAAHASRGPASDAELLEQLLIDPDVPR